MADNKNPVLIVDLDETHVESLNRIIKEEGLKSVFYKQGIDACSHINSTPVVGVICAVKIGGMKAGVVFSAIANSKYKVTPLVIHSEEKDEQVFAMVQNNPYTTYLTGPFQPKEIQKALNILISVCDNASDKGTKNTYDVRLINSYIEASKQVIEHYCGESLKIGKPVIKSSQKATAEVTSLISIAGDKITGSLAISMPRDLFVFLRNKMTFQFKDKYEDVEINDTAGELANQICGALKRKLSELGFKTTISLPKVIVGQDYQIDHLSKNPVLMLPIVLDQHSGTLEFCFQRNSNSEKPKETTSSNDAGAGDIILF